METTAAPPPPTGKDFPRNLLPGLNLPLNFAPGPAKNVRRYVQENSSLGPANPSRRMVPVRTDVPALGQGEQLLPSALNDVDVREEHIALPMITLREITMLNIMNSITDKPDWDKKVFNAEIALKWKEEMLAQPNADVTEKMADWVIEELKYKADLFKELKAVSVFNGDVVKSDLAISATVKDALRAAVKPLEDVPVFHKDYHPGSDGQVVDLVHPSLFPLIYGRSRILEDSVIGLDDCLGRSGDGVIIKKRPVEEAYIEQSDLNRTPEFSTDYQWLPSDLEFAEDGSVKFTSYINNLHPIKFRGLYTIIEDIITRTIPIWNMTLTPLKAMGWRYPRIEYNCIYRPEIDDIPDDDQGPQQEEDEDDDDYFNRRYEWKESISRPVQPEPGTFSPPTVPNHRRREFFEPGTDTLLASKSMDLRRDFAYRGLQVIVKLANIELTPEKPDYRGGVWHVEGQLNEHICATALYYYDNENIKPSHLAFRQQTADETIDIGYPQSQHSWLHEVFGMENEEAAVQEVGSVLCSEGRLLTFPNILQHRVQPFSLADGTKRGHRKILALFLVDPNIRVIGTANVPPQQRDWWAPMVAGDFGRAGKAMGVLSIELKDKVFEGVEWPIGLDEAKEVRAALMEERSKYTKRGGDLFVSTSFSLCEH